MVAFITFWLSSHYPDGQNGVKLEGLDNIEYMLGGLVNFVTRRLTEFMSLSWQVKFSVSLVVGGTILVVYMLCRLYGTIRKRHTLRRIELDTYARFHQQFREILNCRELLTETEINDWCGIDVESEINQDGEWEIRHENGSLVPVSVMSKVVVQVRLEMMTRRDFNDFSSCISQNDEILYLPNIATLCKVTGVKGLYEARLEKRRDVLRTLQDLLTLTLPVTEGYLARYTGHSNKDIKYMARMCHVFCTKAEPYRYMEEDLKGSQPLWYPMMLHRLLGWLKQTNQSMPKFVLMANETKNDDSAAFLIKEIGFWGEEDDKKSVFSFLDSQKRKCVEAALDVLGVKGNTDAELVIKKSYNHQPEYIRRECLKAIRRIESGESADFFVNAFEETSSLETKACALECLYTYGKAGLGKFIEISDKYAKNESMSDLIHEVESIQIAKQAGLVNITI